MQGGTKQAQYFIENLYYAYNNLKYGWSEVEVSCSVAQTTCSQELRTHLHPVLSDENKRTDSLHSFLLFYQSIITQLWNHVNGTGRKLSPGGFEVSLQALHLIALHLHRCNCRHNYIDSSQALHNILGHSVQSKRFVIS